MEEASQALSMQAFGAGSSSKAGSHRQNPPRNRCLFVMKAFQYIASPSERSGGPSDEKHTLALFCTEKQYNEIKV